MMKKFFKVFLMLACWFNLKGQVDHSSSIQLKRDLIFYSDSSYLQSHTRLQRNGIFLGFRHKEAFVKQWQNLPDGLRTRIYSLNDYFGNQGYGMRNELKDFLSAVALVGTEQSVNHLDNFLTITTKNRSKLSRQAFSNFFKTIIGTLERQHLFEFSKDYIGLDNKNLELHYEPLPPNYRNFDNSGDSTIYISVGGKVELKTFNDLLVLENLTGIYLPHKRLLLVEKAQTDWRIRFLDQEKVFVKLKNFTVSALNYKIEAEDALLTYQKEPFNFRDIRGRFTYLKRQRPGMPLFQSYRSGYKIPLKSNLELIGGFTLRGKSITAQALNEKKTIFRIKKAGKTKFQFVSQQGIEIQDSVLTSQSGEVTFYLDQNKTIEHPAMSLYYDIRRNKLVNRKDKRRYRRHPITNNLQKILIDTEQISWLTDKDSVYFDILNAREDIPLTAASDRYFKFHDYKSLQGLLNFNPLKIAIYYSIKSKSKTIKVADLARFYKLKSKVVRNGMQYLEYVGLGDYDPLANTINLNERAYFYTKSAHILNRFENGLKNKSKHDYDQIKINSRVTAGHNAIYTFEDQTFTIRGVKIFSISDSLNTRIKPENSTISLKRGRDISLHGTIQAGQSVYYGHNFNFKYDTFKIVMEEIDSMGFLLPDSLDPTKIIELPNKILYTKGALYLSASDNKSGLKTYSQYPKLEMIEESIVDFNGAEILDGAYDSTVEFKVEPFQQDSLGDFNPQKMKLKGLFKSGIFPDFNETLLVQKDYSLGFQGHQTPEAGLEVFQNVDNIEAIIFKGTINLDNRGITSEGKIDYLTSNLNSKLFTYYQDSIVTNSGFGAIAALEESDKYPDVILPRFSMSWDIKNDKMNLATQDTSFKIYDDIVNFEGILTYGEQSLIGRGKVTTEDYEEKSDSFSFFKDTYETGGGDLLIKSESGSDTISLIAENVNSMHDLPNQTTTMYKAGIENSFSFPKIGYETSIEKAVWYQDSNKIEMTNIGDEPVASFTSNNLEEDSLTFKAAKATYDKNEKLLHIKVMEPVIVGNNEIRPDNNEVFIREATGLDRLHNAQIYINKDTRYHHLTEAEIDIKSSHEFIGQALYNFKKTDGKIVKIRFNAFDINRVEDLIAQTRSKDKLKELKKLKQKYITEAEADVPVDAPLDLFEGLEYYGKVFLKDYVKSLSLDGGIRLHLDRSNNPTFAYKSVSAQEYSTILVDPTLKSLDNEPLLAGIYRNTQENELFGNFIQTTDIPKFKPIFEGNGNLTFDSEYKTYKILPQEENRIKPAFVSDIINIGNALVYDYAQQKLDFSGTLNLLQENKNYQFKSVGVGEYDIAENSFEANCLFSFTLGGLSNLLRVFAADFEPKIAEDGSFKPKVKDVNFALKLAQLFSPSAFRRLDAKIIRERRTAELFKNQILFSKLNLTWSPETHAFFNDGQVNISNVLNKHLDNNVRGYIEIPKSENNHTIHMFFINEDEEWYYFEIEKNKFSTLSSNSEYNLLAATNKSKQFNVQIADYDQIVGYVDLFRRDYLGLEDHITLKEPEEIVISKKKPSSKADEPEIEETDELFAEDDFSDDIADSEEVELDIPKKGKKKDKKEATDAEESLFEDLVSDEDEGKAAQKTKRKQDEKKKSKAKKSKKSKKEANAAEEALFEDLASDEDEETRRKEEIPTRSKIIQLLKEVGLFNDIEEAYLLTDDDLYTLYKQYQEELKKSKKKKKKKK